MPMGRGRVASGEGARGKRSTRKILGSLTTPTSQWVSIWVLGLVYQTPCRRAPARSQKKKVPRFCTCTCNSSRTMSSFVKFLFVTKQRLDRHWSSMQSVRLVRVCVCSFVCQLTTTRVLLWKILWKQHHTDFMHRTLYLLLYTCMTIEGHTKSTYAWQDPRRRRWHKANTLNRSTPREDRPKEVKHPASETTTCINACMHQPIMMWGACAPFSDNTATWHV